MLSRLAKIMPMSWQTIRITPSQPFSATRELKVLDDRFAFREYNNDVTDILDKFAELEQLEYRMLNTTDSSERNDLLERMIQVAQDNHLLVEAKRYKRYRFKKWFKVKPTTAAFIGLIATSLYLNNRETKNVEPTKIEVKKTFADVLVGLKGN